MKYVRIKYKIEAIFIPEEAMAAISAILRRLSKRIKRSVRRGVKRTRMGARRAARNVLLMDRRKRIAVLSGGLMGAAALIVAIMIVCVNGARSAKASADNDGSRMPASAPDAVQGLMVVPEPTPTFAPEPTLEPTPTPTPDPTLRRGMERDDVEPLQRRLIELGFMELDEPTRKFGPATENAVRLFQRQVNFTDTIDVQLQEDGIAGEQTLALLYSQDAPKYIVKYGMQGDDITEMQDQLKDLGYMSAVTGNYGDKTVAALKAFQDRNGLSPDGMCGEKTFALLYSDDAKESATKAKSKRTKANIDKMIAVAKKQLGDKYVLGAKGPDKFDCSGLVYYCLKEAGSNRRRLNAAGYSGVNDWSKIEKMSALKRGDLIFFYDDGFTKIGHVGIVLNSSEMIDASNNKGKVVRRDYTTSYWKKHFYCGRRPW